MGSSKTQANCKGVNKRFSLPNVWVMLHLWLKTYGKGYRVGYSKQKSTNKGAFMSIIMVE
jgi:hypothetical protein